MLGAVKSITADELLLRLFCRHFGDPAQALLRLERYLSQLHLRFDFYNHVREVVHPPSPEVPNGLPSFIYYYVPSGWGTHRPIPTNPTDPSFVYHADGIGLNLGCPVRLLRALDILDQLPTSDQVEIRHGLATPTKHLAIIEELLWLSGWNSTSEKKRGGIIYGVKDVDWFFKTEGIPIYLEAKFRPSSWPHLSDRGTFRFMKGRMLEDAAPKFPPQAIGPALHIVGLTGLGNLNEDSAQQLGQELQTYPQIHAIVYRSFAQMTHVLSLSGILVSRVLDLLAQPSLLDYPTNYIVNYPIAERDKRVKKRSSSPTAPENSAVAAGSLKPRFDADIQLPPQDAYRNEIKERRPTGEPIFELTPRLIWQEDIT